MLGTGYSMVLLASGFVLGVDLYRNITGSATSQNRYHGGSRPECGMALDGCRARK